MYAYVFRKKFVNIFKFILHRVAYNPKNIIFPSIFGHLEGRGRPTPIFWLKLKLGIFQNSFSIE